MLLYTKIQIIMTSVVNLQSCGASRNDSTTLQSCGASRNEPTTLQSCGSVIVDNAGSTLLPSCNSNIPHTHTTLHNCDTHNSTTLAHSSKEEAIRACQTWCPETKEECKTTKITQTADGTWHWTVPEKCAFQCPSSR